MCDPFHDLFFCSGKREREREREIQLGVNGHAFIATDGASSDAAYPSRAEVGAERCSFQRRVLTSSRGGQVETYVRKKKRARSVASSVPVVNARAQAFPRETRDFMNETTTRVAAVRASCLRACVRAPSLRDETVVRERIYSLALCRKEVANGGSIVHLGTENAERPHRTVLVRQDAAFKEV